MDHGRARRRPGADARPSLMGRLHRFHTGAHRNIDRSGRRPGALRRLRGSFPHVPFPHSPGRHRGGSRGRVRGPHRSSGPRRAHLLLPRPRHPPEDAAGTGRARLLRGPPAHRSRSARGRFRTDRPRLRRTRAQRQRRDRPGVRHGRRVVRDPLARGLQRRSSDQWHRPVHGRRNRRCTDTHHPPGHPISGIVPFTVGETAVAPTPTTHPATATPTSTAAAAAAASDADTGRLFLVGGAGATIAVLVLILVLTLRRRRTADVRAPRNGEER